MKPFENPPVWKSAKGCSAAIEALLASDTETATDFLPAHFPAHADQANRG